MPSHVLISPGGFLDWKTIQVLQDTEFDHLVFLRTSHPKAKQHAKSIARLAKEKGFTFEETEVSPAFGMLAWCHALRTAAQRYGAAERTINLTSGHGVALGAATIVALQEGIPCVCYDIVDGKLHRANPSAVAQFDTLGDTERSILRLLKKRPLNVTDLQTESKVKLSTLSMALQRLRSAAWVESVREGKAIRYSLHAGVAELVQRI